MNRMRDADVVRRRRLGPRAGAQHYPVITIVIATLLMLIPSTLPGSWWPNLALLTLIAWRLRRGDAFPHWWAVPIGLFYDLVTGHPLGMSIVTFTLAMIVADLSDLRLRWRSHWTEWAIAVVLVAMAESIEWLVNLIAGAPAPYRTILPPVAMSALLFPLIAVLIEKLDDFRLRR